MLFVKKKTAYEIRISAWSSDVCPSDLIANHGRIIRGGYIAMRCGTDGLVDCRNKAVAEFLAEGTADWPFWVDTDKAFAPDTVDRLTSEACQVGEGWVSTCTPRWPPHTNKNK